MKPRKRSRVSRSTEQAHAERLQRKQERLEVLQALAATWENHKGKNPEYLKELQQKTVRLQDQLRVMAI